MFQKENIIALIKLKKILHLKKAFFQLIVVIKKTTRFLVQTKLELGLKQSIIRL